ncbi:MAG: acyl carrier protein [Planctomycetia bacterium]|jgi:acyl carrier protein
MNDEGKIRATVLEILGGIAPEADLAALAPDANFRRELDLDSMDFQNFVIRVCKALAVHIPDRDAAQLTTVAKCIDYLR